MTTIGRKRHLPTLIKRHFRPTTISRSRREFNIPDAPSNNSDCLKWDRPRKESIPARAAQRAMRCPLAAEGPNPPATPRRRRMPTSCPRPPKRAVDFALQGSAGPRESHELAFLTRRGGATLAAVCYAQHRERWCCHVNQKTLEKTSACSGTARRSILAKGAWRGWSGRVLQPDRQMQQHKPDDIIGLSVASEHIRSTRRRSRAVNPSKTA
jgi:hypothetical protein